MSLQSVPAGAEAYDWRFFLDQVRGARQGGADGFLFWHAGSHYQRMHVALQGPVQRHFPFPIEERARIRRGEPEVEGQPPPPPASDQR